MPDPGVDGTALAMAVASAGVRRIIMAIGNNR